MYVARKNVLENREITLISKGEMSFATETRLVYVAKRPGLGVPIRVMPMDWAQNGENAGTGELRTDDVWVGLDIARRLSA
jgi:hypothetical protein